MQNQAWRDAFALSRNATKRAALAAGRVPPPVYGNLGGPFVHPFAVVMTGSVDVFWMELFTWMSSPGHPTPFDGAGYAFNAPAADSSLSYKVAESAVWDTNGTWTKPVWSDTRRNIYNAPTRMWLAEARSNGAVPFQMDGSLSPTPGYVWGDIDPNTTFLIHSKFVNANRWLFTGEARDRLADTAIVYCLSCVEWRRMSSLNTGGRPPHFVQLSAIGRLFEDEHVPYEVVLFGHPDLYVNDAGAARLRTKRWKRVILPSVDVLSDEDIELLSAFVRGGGILKTLGTNGVTDAELVPRTADPMAKIAAAASNGGALMPVAEALFEVYANRSTESTDSAAPLLRELARGADTKVPWRIEGPGADQQPPRLWANCWSHSLYAVGRGRSSNAATVCHLANFRIDMTPPLNETGGLVIPSKTITVWVRGDFQECVVYSPTRNKTTLTLQHRGKMTGCTVNTMDEYAVVAFGASGEAQGAQAAAAEVRKWLSRLVIASGTNGVRLGAIAPLLRDAEASLAPPTALGSPRLGVSKLVDLAEELQRAVGCIASGAKGWQRQARQPVLDLEPAWGGHLLKLDFGDGPVLPGFSSVTAGASKGQCPRLCQHALSQNRHNPNLVCVCPAPAGGWPHNATHYSRASGFGFLSCSNLEAGNTGDPDEFHADNIVSNRTATFRIDVPGASAGQELIVTLVIGALDVNVIRADGGTTPSEGVS